MYVYIYIYMYMYARIYTERERERERKTSYYIDLSRDTVEIRDRACKPRIGARGVENSRNEITHKTTN